MDLDAKYSSRSESLYLTDRPTFTKTGPVPAHLHLGNVSGLTPKKAAASEFPKRTVEMTADFVSMETSPLKISEIR